MCVSVGPSKAPIDTPPQINGSVIETALAVVARSKGF